MKTFLRRVRRTLRRVRKAALAEVSAFWRSRAIRENDVVYESFAGNGVLDNPEAIFRALLRRTEYRHLNHIWVLDDLRTHRRVQSEFAHAENVTFVRYRSVRYWAAVSRAHYLVNNATFPPEFGKREGQVYLNTWHGTPLKSMGYDMADGAHESANVSRNFLGADFLLSQNSFMTQTMYGDAYRLRGLFEGVVIEGAYPRIDRQNLGPDDYLNARETLHELGLDLDSRTTVLYAPTWKGTSFQRPDDDIDELCRRVAELEATLDRSRFRVVVKTHQVVHTLAAARPELHGNLVPNDVPTNVVLGVADVLITDFSSIFFDFLATGRPIAFLVPPDEDYESTRGTYFAPKELPGPVLATMREVGAWISGWTNPLDDEIADRYASWRRTFIARRSASAADRVIDVVLGGALVGADLVRLRETTKPKVLLYLGGMRSNGITSSALNLLRALDHDNVDVTVVYQRSSGRQERFNRRKISPRVRQLPRLGGMNGSKIDHLRRRISVRFHQDRAHVDSLRQRRLWDDEWTRCFGDARFDVVIDFSGYAPFWATLLLHSPEALRAIWLHNDMLAEVDRIVHGRRRMRHTLRSVIDLYAAFDRLVSVSDALNQVNRARLQSAQRPSSVFVAARNMVDIAEVTKGADASLVSAVMPPPQADLMAPVAPLPNWMQDFSDPGLFWFLTVGRFSPEKNQDRLLRAFASVHTERPETRLLVIGYGPLRASLERHVERLGLQGAAHIAGPFDNPFPIMASADGFVLSSDYEGQPMVLLEAAVLQLPIVTVAFSSVEGVLEAGAVRITAQQDEALARGLRELADGAVPRAHLDAESYNRQALEDFLHVTRLDEMTSRSA